MLIENDIQKLLHEFNITENRVMKLFAEILNKISLAYKSSTSELKKTKIKNEELKRKIEDLEKGKNNKRRVDNAESPHHLDDDLEINENDNLDTDEIEHVYLDYKGNVEYISTIPVCKENRSGLPWSKEEEERIMVHPTNA